MNDLTKEQEKMLNKLYYEKNYYFGRDKIFNALKHLENHPTQIQINNWLKNQEVHQLHIKPKPSNILKPVITKKPNYLFQMDLIDMGQYAYDDYRYILTLIDVFTKKAYIQIMKNKTPYTLLKKFIKLNEKLENEGIFIKKLQTDNGAEFKSSDFEDFLNDNNILHIYSLPGRPQSQGIIERFNGTLKSLIHKTMQATNSKNWPSFIKQLVNNYNNSYHSTIKMNPNNALNNKREVYTNIKKTVKNTGKKFTDINVGDKVRIKIFKNNLDKTSTQNWSDNIHTIIKIVQPKNPYSSTKYFIEGIDIAYSHNDIQKISNVVKAPSKIKYIPKGEYEVEKITNKKKKNGLMVYEVYWRGYTDPTWEPYNNIKDTIAYKVFLKSNKLK